MDLGTPEVHRTTAEGGCGGLCASRASGRGLALLAADCRATRIILGPRRVGKTSLLVCLLPEKSWWEAAAERDDFWHALGLLPGAREAAVSCGIQERHRITSVRSLSAGVRHEVGTFEVVPHLQGNGHRDHGGIHVAGEVRGHQPRKKKLDATTPPRTSLRLTSTSTSGQISSTELTKSSGLDAATAAYSDGDCLLAGPGSPFALGLVLHQVQSRVISNRRRLLVSSDSDTRLSNWASGWRPWRTNLQIGSYKQSAGGI
jgi:hypothetical protein